MKDKSLARFFIFTFLVLSFLVSPSLSNAQSKESKEKKSINANAESTETATANNSSCLSLDVLQSLVHLPIMDVFDVLGEYGYTIGSVTDTIYDTVESFILKYQRTAFYNRTATSAQSFDPSQESNHTPSQASVVLMESLDGLSNYVIHIVEPKGNCNPLQELAQHNYVLNKERSSFQGSYLHEGTIEQFEIVLNEDTNVWLSCQYIGELNQYIDQKKTAVYKVINNAIALARTLTKDYFFDSAFTTIDTLMGYYKPADDTLLSCRKFVEEQRNKYYTSRMNQAIANVNYILAAELCDTLLSFNPANAEELKKTHALLTAQLDHKVASFKSFCPEVYDSIRIKLQQIFNQDIRENLYFEPQELSVSFTFRTNKENESRGHFDLSHKGANSKSAKADLKRVFYLNEKIDSLAKSPLIRPIRENNIFVITEDNISTTAMWNYSTLTINGSTQRDSSLLSRFIDTIENHYFLKEIISKKELNEDGSYKVTKVRRLPTKRIYTFGITQKEANNQTVSDIYLVDFETALGDSWLPSLLVPGLGTRNQEARYDVASRAIPFYLFGGLGIAGLWWEHHCKVNGIQRFDPRNNNDGTFIYWKNSGYFVGSLGLFVAGTIYITDIVGGIKNSINNAKRTKDLRKRLKESAIVLQTQDVILQ